MENTFRRVYKTLILTAGLLVFAACGSDDNDDPKPKQDLPTFTNLSVRVGDTGSLAFDAYGTWTLSSDKTWFKLASETGVAGEQTVGYTVTDDEQGFLDDQATITFAIGTRSTTFTATRTAKDRTLKLYTKVYNDESGEWSYNEMESLALAFAENARTYNANFAVVANYDWKLTVPAWISVDQDHMSGQANPDTQAADADYQWITVDFAGATNDDMAGELVFADQTASDAHIAKGITCPGAKNYMLPDAAFSVSMNAAGKYVHDGMVDGQWQEGIEEDAYTFTAKAGYDGITFFKVWKDGNYYGVDPTGMGLYEYDATWCGVDAASNKTLGPGVKEYTYELWAGANDGGNRAATIIGLPDAMAEGLTAADLVASGDEAIKDEYQVYIITELEQTGATGGLEFEYGQYVQDITLEKMAEGDELDRIKSEWSVEMVYVMTFDSFVSATMASMKLLGYTGEELVPIFDPQDARLDDNARTGWVDFTPNAGTMMMATISDDYVPFTAQRSALVVLQDKATYINQVAIKIVQNAANTGE